MSAPVFADVDTGVDDALALTYLLASADADLVGIACTAGNVAVQAVCRNTLDLLAACRADGVAVSRGAERPLGGVLPTSGFHGPTGLGYAQLPPSDRPLTDYDAATAWVRAAHAHRGALIGVATGPLTNVALALRIEPALPTLLHRLVIMGGCFDGGTEFNIGVDPEAAAAVFAAWAAHPPIVCGLELTERIAMTPAHLDRLAAVAGSAANPLVRALADAVRYYFEVHDARGHGYLAYLHDPLAAAVALDPALVVTRPAAIAVALTGARGTTVADWSAKPNALIGVEVDPALFFETFIDRVGAFARRL